MLRDKQAPPPLAVAKKALFNGKFREAHAAAQQILRTESQNPEAVMVMAAIALEHDNAKGAAALCDLLVRADVRSAWLEVLHARIALLRQQQEQARAHARCALELENRNPHVAGQLGVVLSRTGHHGEAVKPLQMAVAKAPDNVDFRYNLAVALQFAGALEQAESAFRQVVGRDPSHGRAWLALVQLAQAADEGWHATLTAQFDKADKADDRLLLGHALARIAEREQRWEQSFDWLCRAKAEKRTRIAHDRSFVARLSGAAIASARQPIEERPHGDQRPIFVLGMPRSGTTLVERILTSHSQTRSVGELSDFAIVLKNAMATSGQLVLDSETVEAAAAAQDLRDVGEAYLARAGMLAGDAARFVDKMPFNAFYAPAILRALPGARVICLRRSPHDLLFANFRQLFATGYSYYSYAYDFEDTAHFIARFEAMASHFEATLPARRFMAIRYEDLVADQRGKTAELLDFAGLEWEDACLDFHSNAEPVATASSVQVRSPLYSSSIGQWRRYGDAAGRAEEMLREFQAGPPDASDG